MCKSDNKFSMADGLVRYLSEGAYDVLLVADVICFPISH